MLKNMAPYDEHKHREQLGLLGAAVQTSSAPVEVGLEFVDDLVDAQTDLADDPNTDDLQLVP